MGSLMTSRMTGEPPTPEVRTASNGAIWRLRSGATPLASHPCAIYGFRFPAFMDLTADPRPGYPPSLRAD
jgi:hypothetical protein